MIRLATIRFWEEINAIGAVGRAPQRPNCCLGQSPEVRGRPVLKLARGIVEARAAMTSDRGGVRSVWPFLDVWESVRLRTTATQWNVPGRYRPYGGLFFFMLKKEPRSSGS